MRAIFLLLCAVTAAAQTPVDSALLAYINTIRAIDSHAHPMRPVAPGVPADTDFDALPLDGIPPFPVPARMGGLDPVWRAAQSALYHVPAARTDAGRSARNKPGVRQPRDRAMSVGSAGAPARCNGCCM